MDCPIPRALGDPSVVVKAWLNFISFTNRIRHRKLIHSVLIFFIFFWNWEYIWVTLKWYYWLAYHFFFLLCNVNVHISNIKPLIWVAPSEHSIENGNHFYIRLCYAERKTTLAWKTLEISHQKALFSPPQPKHFTERGQTARTEPKLHNASTRKLS